MTYINSNNFIKEVKFIYLNLDELIRIELIAKNRHFAKKFTVYSFLDYLAFTNHYNSIKNIYYHK